MERFYNIAGSVIKVTGKDEEMSLEEGILADFRVETDKYDREVLFYLVDELSEEAGECIYKDAGKRIFQDRMRTIRYIGAVEKSLEGAYLRISRTENKSNVEVRREAVRGKITAKVVLNSLETEHFIIRAHGFILHASFVLYNGKAILFTAPSGTGKSTQAELWRVTKGAKIINGDRAVVKKCPEGFEAWGIPFAGSSGIAEQGHFPLSAIVYLAQAERTSISRMPAKLAFRCVWEGISINTWDAEDVALASNTALELISQVPVYFLPCTPDESAVQTLEFMLRREK